MLKTPISHILLIGSLLVLLLPLAPLCSHAQLSAYSEPFSLYRDAEELFAQEKYGAAQRKFGEFLVKVGANQSPLREEVVPALPVGNDRVAQAHYFQTVCAYRLRQNDAEQRMLGFLAVYSEHALANTIRYSLGKWYFDAGNYKSAVLYLGESFSRQGLSPEMTESAEFMLGYAYLQKDELESAAAYLEKASQKPTVWREKAQYYYSVLLYRQGDYSGAYEAFQDVRKSKTYAKEIQVYLANCLLQLQRYQELETLSSALESEGITDPQVYYIIANAAYEEEDYEKAGENFLLYAKNRGYMSRVDKFRYAYALYVEDDFKKSFDVFLDVISAANDSLSQASNYYMGFCAYKTQTYEVARSAFLKASKMEANPVIRQDAQLYYAKVCLQSQYYEDALNALKAFEKDYPKSPYIDEVRSLIGELMLYSSNYVEAISYLESVPRTTARSKEAYQSVAYNYALELYKQGKYTDADPYFRKVIASDIDHAKTLSAYYWMGEGRSVQKQYQPAIDAYTTYSKQSGAKKHELYAMAQYGIAWCHFNMKSYTSALTAFEEFIALGSRDVDSRYLCDAYLRAGDCLFMKREYSKADNFYLSASKIKSEERDYGQYQLGESAYRQQKYTASIGHFDKMVRDYRQSDLRDDALNRLATICVDWVHDTTKAQIYDKMLILEHPNSPYLADAYIRIAYAQAEKQPQEAISNLKTVLEKFPKDRKNCQLALDGLGMLMDEASFKELEASYLKQTPAGNEQFAKIQFDRAKQKFFDKDFTGAINDFSEFLLKNPAIEYAREARLFRARAHDRMGETQPALNDYDALYKAQASDGPGLAALKEAAELRFRLGEYTASLAVYQLLEKASDKPMTKAIGQQGMADCHMAIENYGKAEELLLALTTNEELSYLQQAKAFLKLGQVQLRQQKLEKALETFTTAEYNFDGDQAAEAQYWVMAASLALQRPTETRLAIQKLVNDYPTYNYWKARGFLLLADMYLIEGNTYNARATLESLITDERFPDVKQEAEKKMALLPK